MIPLLEQPTTMYFYGPVFDSHKDGCELKYKLRGAGETIGDMLDRVLDMMEEPEASDEEGKDSDESAEEEDSHETAEEDDSKETGGQ